MIRFSSIDVEMPPIKPSILRDWIDDIARRHNKEVGELYYYFCSDEELLRINTQRLNHNFYTDIITFPLDNNEHLISSEFCISTDRVLDNSVRLDKPFDEELCRVIIHGFLHLIGFNDLTETDEKFMREKEEECLKILHK